MVFILWGLAVSVLLWLTGFYTGRVSMAKELGKDVEAYGEELKRFYQDFEEKMKELRGGMEE